ncbi:MAG: amidohydrolase/deacetylase family metallohydrolase [Chloroflexi bacterium]|nr:amidohydrolase/deacetylase family metallohydrolase [Chloroflexota bacterium]
MSNGNYDLILAGGRVLDPGSGLDQVGDIGISGGKIVEIGGSLDAASAGQVVDVSGKIVAPGLIDLHTHVAGGIGKVIDETSFANADQVGVHGGVTTVVDAGSTGSYNVGGMINHVIPRSKTRIFVFINAGILGIHRIPEIRDASDIDIDHAIATIQASEHIRGVKVRMVSPSVQSMGAELARKAKQIASGAGVPVMVHIGDIPDDHPKAGEAAKVLLSEILTEGDIVTHTCSHHVGALLDNGKLRPEALEAKERGVIFDVGVGRANFSFDSAKAIMDQGITPHTISSDVTAAGRYSLAFGLIESMNKFLTLGFSVEDVTRMTTTNSATSLGESGNLGALAVGREADISVLDTVQGSFIHHDAAGGSNTGDRAIVPVFTVRAGEVQPLDPGPHPWGWAPESA